MDVPKSPDIAARIAACDWAAVEREIGAVGHAVLPGLLTGRECREIGDFFDDDSLFRSRIDMARFNFGQGAYAYFKDPLPAAVGTLRAALYEALAPIATRMASALQRPAAFPPTLAAFARECRKAGQSKPTPLLLRYDRGDFNRLHRDLYGALSFPLQATALLSKRDEDFAGGEFLLVENRPRQQSIGTVVQADRGDLIVFPVNERPVPGKRRMLRASVRHGVSRLTAGRRYALGLIFHDAR